MMAHLMGTAGYRVPTKFQNLGTGYRPEKFFWVPIGTGYQPNFQRCRSLDKSTISAEIIFQIKRLFSIISLPIDS